MFNFAIFQKTVRDSWLSLALASSGLVAFVVLFVWAMQTMGSDLMKFVSKYPFIQKIMEMSLGIQIEGGVSSSILFAVCFTHGAVLGLVWSVLIATTTRITAGEVERGTAELLLTLPVNRSEVFISTSLVWIFAAAILSYCPLLGIWIGTLIFELDTQTSVAKYVAPATNFFCLNLAIGGLSTLAGCLLNRRSVAIGAVVAIAFVSIILNFLEPLIEPMKRIRFLGLLSYFRPADVVRTGEWPITSMLVLVSIALATWLAGLVVFCRKDIPTT